MNDIFSIASKQVDQCQEYKGNFPEILRDLRKGSPYHTLEKLAEKVGVTRQSIGYYEKGERIPDTETLIKLADVFGVSCDYLLGRCILPNELGLSQKALSRLEVDVSCECADYVSVLSKLIEHEKFPTLCKIIENYLVEEDFIDDVAESFITEATATYTLSSRDMLVESLYQNLARDYLWEIVNDMKPTKKRKSNKKEASPHGDK